MLVLAKPTAAPHSWIAPRPCGHGSGLYFFNFSSNRRNGKRVVRLSAKGPTFQLKAAAQAIIDKNEEEDNGDAASGVDGTTGGTLKKGNNRVLTASFEKLKAQKVKAIARKASLIRQKVGLDLDGVENGVHEISDSDRAGSEVSVPGAGTASYFRGWGNGGSIRSYEPKSVDPLRGRQKFSAENDFFSRKSFRELGCSEFMIQSLKEQGLLRPSHIQALAFAPVSVGKSCVISDQSGSGKTLAYLIPVIQRLRQEELQGLGDSLSQGPKVLIMVPTAELASQVLSDCRSISKFGVPFRSMVVTGGFRQRTQMENLEQGVDVLIATPGRFMFLVKEGLVDLTNIRCVVLDEVDILFINEDFEAVLQSLINSSPVSAQYLFVTATLPVDVYGKLIEVFPDCEVIMGPGMHRTSNGLQEVLVDCSGENGTEKTPESAFLNKKTALLQLMEQSPVSKTIVFCNKIETCRKVENVIKRFDRSGRHVRVLPFHAALAQELRLANMKEFINSSSEEHSLFLVCTDRASRGIDFTGVEHVILFDFPRDPSEYVRRVGRTARGAGGKGKAFIFVVGKQVSLARKIIERNQKGHPLHDVPQAYMS